ncbi:hypothetical protein ASE39_23645 [Acidovorax sp. Root267]|uniref:hypothetical protein n=1 Tax=Acidovorax sp. Root267 TaxID=1736505 RepID=UPI000708A01B|nr:hypothetical protein [Acidovorax sp. Root267]KRD25108.1 hypothetical protein ASE39_23645 [Acidovorax sp. Root267]
MGYATSRDYITRGNKFESLVEAMLLSRIQRDLFDFTSQEDSEDFGPLLNFWYRANTPALSAALTAQPGLKLIVDAPSTRALEQMSQKLFLLADTIVLRGLSPEPPTTLPVWNRST